MKKLLLGAVMLLSFGAWAQKKAKLDPTAATKDAALNALNNAYEADKKTALQTHPKWIKRKNNLWFLSRRFDASV